MLPATKISFGFHSGAAATVGLRFAHSWTSSSTRMSGLSSLSRTSHLHSSYRLYNVGTREIGRATLNRRAYSPAPDLPRGLGVFHIVGLKIALDVLVNKAAPAALIFHLLASTVTEETGLTFADGFVREPTQRQEFPFSCHLCPQLCNKALLSPKLFENKQFTKLQLAND